MGSLPVRSVFVVEHQSAPILPVKETRFNIRFLRSDFLAVNFGRHFDSRRVIKGITAGQVDVLCALDERLRTRSDFKTDKKTFEEGVA
jgi:hypothetical protein